MDVIIVFHFAKSEYHFISLFFFAERSKQSKAFGERERDRKRERGEKKERSQ